MADMSKVVAQLTSQLKALEGEEASARSNRRYHADYMEHFANQIAALTVQREALEEAIARLTEDAA